MEASASTAEREPCRSENTTAERCCTTLHVCISHPPPIETLSARFVVPERLAVPQLGRLRELLLREARLLDTLSHSCVVPLESGWLEQRTGFEDHRVCASTVCRGCPSSGIARNRAEGVGEGSESAPAAEQSGSGEDGCGRFGDLGSEAGFPVSGGDGRSGEENDVAAFLLRSCVPLTLEDVDGDDSDGHQGEWGELASDNEDIGNGGESRNNLQYGGLKQLRWGGDDKTNWRGTAEPKQTAHRSALTPAAGITLGRKAHNNVAAIGECLCSCTCRGRLSINDDGGRGFPPRRRECMLSLASYLLLPDWLPLSLWFETEFEPRTASPDTQGGAVTTRAVTAPGDWALVWRHLVSMFVQVRSSSN